jgi:hypothetical protein
MPGTRSAGGAVGLGPDCSRQDTGLVGDPRRSQGFWRDTEQPRRGFAQEFIELGVPQRPFVDATRDRRFEAVATDEREPLGELVGRLTSPAPRPTDEKLHTII